MLKRAKVGRTSWIVCKWLEVVGAVWGGEQELEAESKKSIGLLPSDNPTYEMKKMGGRDRYRWFDVRDRL